MKQVIYNWYKRYLSDPEAVILFFFLIAGILIVTILGSMLAPVLAGLVIAYLLEGLVGHLENWKIPHRVAASFVFLIFLSIFILLMFILLPLLLRQLTTLLTELPVALGRAQAILMHVQTIYADYLTIDEIDKFIAGFKQEAARYGQQLLSFSLASILPLVTLVVYLVMVPLLVFFFLWDRDQLVAWFIRCLPKKRRLMNKVWTQVNKQLGNYVRGKVLEIAIITIISYIPFVLMGLPYSMLLAVLLGVSVIIPFIGIAVVTIPIFIIALMQWGLSPTFVYLILIYTAICIFDANVLVPLLFSGAVNIHPIAIIVAILFFGGFWGFWGVFFAIPLATLVQAVVMAWPRATEQQTEVSAY